MCYMCSMGFIIEQADWMKVGSIWEGNKIIEYVICVFFCDIYVIGVIYAICGICVI